MDSIVMQNIGNSLYLLGQSSSVIGKSGLKWGALALATSCGSRLILGKEPNGRPTFCSGDYQGTEKITKIFNRANEVSFVSGCGIGMLAASTLFLGKLYIVLLMLNFCEAISPRTQDEDLVDIFNIIKIYKASARVLGLLLIGVVAHTLINS